MLTRCAVSVCAKIRQLEAPIRKLTEQKRCFGLDHSQMLALRAPSASGLVSSRNLSSSIARRHFSQSTNLWNKKDAEKAPSFANMDEYRRLKDPNAGTIDDQGNYQAPGGLSMPTQSAGGLTKRNTEDFTSFDIFGNEGATITAYSESGFAIGDEYADGSVVIFPKRFWTWNVSSIADITIESLAPVWLHNPTPRTYP